MVNSAAWMASTFKPKSNASAAASKAGPRFAEVAGRNMRKGMAEESRCSAIAFFLRLQCSQDGVGTGVQNHGSLSLLSCQGMKRLVFHAWDREIAAMKLNGVLRIFQHVSGQHQHNRV